MSELEFIDDSERLAALVDRVRASDWVAVDTEFLSDRAFVPRLCLVQVATAELVACIDVLQPIDPSPLWTVLRDPGITKVFHAAENDLAVLLPPVGAVPSPVFDTQLAAAFCGYGERIGYGDLVERLCGTRLDKSLARTDWSRRPLPGKSLQYAADDVRYLRALYTGLVRELDVRGRRGWAEEEFLALAEPARYRDDPTEAWRRVRGHATLDAAALAVLQELAQWREHEARNTNRPRRWVLSDDALCGIARRAPRTPEQLDRVRGFEPGRHSAYRATILKLVEHGRAQADRAPRCTGSAASATTIALVLRGVAEQRALELDVPAALLAPFADLVRAATGARDLPLFRGWRGELLGVQVAGFLAGELALENGPAGLRFGAKA